MHHVVIKFTNLNFRIRNTFGAFATRAPRTGAQLLHNITITHILKWRGRHWRHWIITTLHMGSGCNIKLIKPVISSGMRKFKDTGELFYRLTDSYYVTTFTLTGLRKWLNLLEYAVRSVLKMKIFLLLSILYLVSYLKLRIYLQALINEFRQL